MSLVRALVGREADVAVETVATVLGREVGNGGVEGCNGLDGLFHSLLKLGLGLLIFGLVLVEPRGVVVFCNFLQEV